MIICRGTNDTHTRTDGQLFTSLFRDKLSLQGARILCHLFFGEVVALVNLPHTVEGFRFLRDDDIDGLAFFLLFCELAPKRDDVRRVGHPVVECFGCVCALLSHDFAPVDAEMIDDRFDCLVRIAEIFLVELFDVLLLVVRQWR